MLPLKYDKKRKALIDLLLTQSTRSGIAMVIVTTLIAAVVWPYFSTFLVLTWTAIGYTINLSRGYIFASIKKLSPDDNVYYRLEMGLALLLFLSGLFWGITSWLFLIPENTVAFIFVALAVVAIAPSALPAYSALPYIWLIYAAPILLITAAKLYDIGFWQLSILGVINLIGLTPLSKNLGETIEKSITLDIENSKLLDAVSKEKDKAEAANLEKSRFLAAASHDLRQPLHTQGILLEALSLRLKDKKHLEILNKTIQSNDAINSLFNSLLEISQLDARAVKPSFSHQNVTQICVLLINEFQLEAKENGLTIEITGDESVAITDLILLNRILRNLLSNAIKFTATGGVIIHIETNGQHVTISVKDTGIGIPKEQQQHVFNEYFQLGNKARDRSKGIGLGLALVRRMCELLQHDIKVDSVLDQGTCFRLNLPLGERSKVTEKQPEPALNAIVNLKILLIDDEQAILDAMSIMLSDWSCYPRGFTDLDAAMIAIDKEHYKPDLIITDYRLKGDINGLDVIKILQKKLGFKTPAMIISGDTDPVLLEKIHQHDFYLLHKPLKSAQLRKVISLLLK